LPRLLIMPGRNKTAEAVQDAIDELTTARLIGVDADGNYFFPDEVFYRYQSYVGIKNRRETPKLNKINGAENSEKQRRSAENSEEVRKCAENSASLSPSLSLSHSLKKENDEPATPEPSVDSVRKDDRKVKRRELDPRIKRWADRIYSTDVVRFARLAGWITAAERTYDVLVITAALERFAPYAATVRDWWPYLDRLLDKEEGILNARNAESVSERHKAEDRETAGLLLGSRLGASTR